MKNWIRGVFLMMCFSALGGMAGQRVTIVGDPAAGKVGRFAVSELSRYLKKIYPQTDFILDSEAKAGETALFLRLDREGKDLPQSEEGFLVRSDGRNGYLLSRGERGLVYGVYGLLERLGYGFYLSEECVPAPKEKFSLEKWNFSNAPLVKERYLFNWHNFISGCTGWDREQWIEWIDRGQKMGYNAIMVHAYFNNPLHTYSLNGVGKRGGFIATSDRGEDWSNIPLNDVRRIPGGSIFRESRFGCRDAMGPADTHAASTQGMMREVFEYASQRKMGICFSFDADISISSQQRDMIARIPERGKIPVCGGSRQIPSPLDPAGQAFYTAQIRGLVEAYPTLTEIGCWRRNPSWFNGIALKELPREWRDAYQAALAKHPYLKGVKESRRIDCFVTSRLVLAYRRALKTLGREDIAVVTGTWNCDFAVPTALFLEDDTKIMPIDWKVRFNKSLIEDRTFLDEVARYAPGRITPFFWSHHDDGHYIGRSYRPPARLATRMAAAGMRGYGVFHWMNRPHDLFFKNMARQVWTESRDEALEASCSRMAEDYWGRGKLGGYLYRRMTEAPIFGRATQPNMYHRPWRECRFDDRTVERLKGRIAELDRVDTRSMTGVQRERLRYFKTLERFILAFIGTQRHLDEAEEALKRGRIDRAREALGRGRPEEVLKIFSDLSVIGHEERGEMGYLISLACKWLGEYDAFRQRARLIPIGVKLGERIAEPSAQGRCNIHYFADMRGKFWEKLGEAVVLPPLRYPDVSASGGETPCWAAIDGDPASRWAARGSQWIRIDLGRIAAVDSLSIDFYRGEERAYEVEIQASSDLKGWRTLFKGRSTPSPNTKQLFRFPRQKLRYVKILGKGNSMNTYNAYSEIVIGTPDIPAETKRTGIFREAVPPSSLTFDRELFSEGIYIGRARIPIRPIMRAPGVKNGSHVTRGRYCLSLYLRSGEGGKVKAEIAGVEREFAIKGMRRVSLDLALKENGPLTLGLRALEGEIILCGVLLSPI